MEKLASSIVRAGPLDVEEAVGWLARLAQSLEVIHVHGRAHGRISARAIEMLGRGCRSAAFYLDTADLGDDVAYHSPDRLTGGRATPEDDVWALGVLLYFALTGRLPFAGTSSELVGVGMLAAEVEPLASFGVTDERLQQLIDELLAWEPDKRLRSVKQLRAKLSAWYSFVDELPTLKLGKPGLALFDDADEDTDDDDGQKLTALVRDDPDIVRERIAHAARKAAARAPESAGPPASAGPATQRGMGPTAAPRPAAPRPGAARSANDSEPSDARERPVPGAPPPPPPPLNEPVATPPALPPPEELPAVPARPVAATAQPMIRPARPGASLRPGAAVAKPSAAAARPARPAAEQARRVAAAKPRGSTIQLRDYLLAFVLLAGGAVASFFVLRAVGSGFAHHPSGSVAPSASYAAAAAPASAASAIATAIASASASAATAPPSASASAAGAASSAAGERRKPPPIAELSACVQRLFPADAFIDIPSPNLSFVCVQTDTRKAAYALRVHVTRGGARRGVTDAMKEWALLGWYEMAAFAVARGACCERPLPLHTVPTPKACLIDESLERLSQSVLGPDDAEVAAAIAGYQHAVTCVVRAGAADLFGQKGEPLPGASTAFQQFLTRARKP